MSQFAWSCVLVCVTWVYFVHGWILFISYCYFVWSSAVFGIFFFWWKYAHVLHPNQNSGKSLNPNFFNYKSILFAVRKRKEVIFNFLGCIYPRKKKAGLLIASPIPCKSGSFMRWVIWVWHFLYVLSKDHFFHWVVHDWDVTGIISFLFMLCLISSRRRENVQNCSTKSSFCHFLLSYTFTKRNGLDLLKHLCASSHLIALVEVLVFVCVCG